MNLTDLLDRHGVDYRADGHHHCRKGWVQTDCPDCNAPPGNYRLGINLYRLNVNCWACGPKRREEVLGQLLSLAPHQVRTVLTGLVIAPLPVEDRPKAKGKVEVPFRPGPLLPAHQQYLKGRKFDFRQISRLWSVGGIDQYAGPRWQWRLFIPITMHGAIVSWTTRGIHRDQQRYDSATLDQEAFHHKHLLYGEDLVPSMDTVVVCEGPTDVWRVGPGAVCTFGTGYTLQQLSRLAKYRRVFVCYDSEAEGQRMARKLVDELAPFGPEVLNVQLDAKDPGEASPGEIDRLRRLAFGQEAKGRNR